MTADEIRLIAEKIKFFDGMTVNERLYSTGLIDTFDSALIHDKELARTILEGLKVDTASITRILNQR